MRSFRHDLNRIFQILLQSSFDPKISNRCVGDLGFSTNFSLTSLAAHPCEALATRAGALPSLPLKEEVLSGFECLSGSTRRRIAIRWGRTPALLVFFSTEPFVTLQSRSLPLSCRNPHPGPFRPGHSTGNSFVQIRSGREEETRSES